MPAQAPWPVRSRGAPSPSDSAWTLSSTNSEIGIGSFIKLGSDGTVDLATPGDRLLGISKEYKAANAGGSLIVADDPSIRIRIRSDGVANETHKGNLVDITSESVSNSRSTQEVDISTAGTAAAQLRIVDKYDLEGNNWGDANPYLICEIYEHELSRVDPATPGV